MDWEECRHKKLVKEIKTDQNLIDSLVKSSGRKFESNRRLNLDGTTASTKITLAYDSLREILEALAVQKGFKVYSHECFASFLSEFCKEKSFSIGFDRFRVIRNQINYYGKDVSANDAKIIIE